MNSWEQCGLMLMPMKPLSPTELKMTSRDLGRIPGSVSGPVMTKAIHSCFDILSTEASGGFTIQGQRPLFAPRGNSFLTCQ